MIGTRTPFRISFAGGGSDLRSFYSKHPGCVLSTTINKYMYIFVHPFFDEKIQVKYSKTELVENINEIQHPIVREALKKFQIKGIDINSIADIPAGTGLGSSCSFTVGLLHALYAYGSIYASKEKLAGEACELEIDFLKEPIGKQDQYAAAYGGINFITFHPNESVNVEPVILPADKFKELEENLLMFYIGGNRSARDVLKDMENNITNTHEKFNNLLKMTELAQQLRKSLLSGNIKDIGYFLHENWILKKGLSHKISEDKIDYYYNRAIENGASGGKLLGAGGCGFLLFYCEKESHEKLRMGLRDLRELQFRLDNFGTKVIYVGES
ncbi:D,D-heptose 7-phosphate kinase [Candidatus Kuenenia stuttgartiensis]|uniref:D,D-heptose 7-phosphate kinase n=1 Tax=Kuenenia stuttgartiensis TaxID=174633 RepID=Q1Q6W6_KUEST|nr:GHMP kinase [Candidatus Kuenenia stuttgartiensis]QII12874.1 D,D-heptose 7-phosphate kinase [Candidatus Kuenenia stuttgartiensis]CAJ73317.1 similar to mevalonate or galacto kinase [Candidatus Kuenenia stuttgartiensis]